LQWEYRSLIEQLQREKDRMAVINHQQMELIFEAAKEREEVRGKLEGSLIIAHFTLLCVV